MDSTPIPLQSVNHPVLEPPHGHLLLPGPTGADPFHGTLPYFNHRLEQATCQGAWQAISEV